MRAENESLKLDQYMAPYSDHAPPEQCNDNSAASFFSHEESGKVQDEGNADGDQSIAPIMEDTQEGSRRELTEADTIFPVTHASHESSETILNPTGSDDVSERTDDAVDLLSQRLSASGLGQSPSIDIKKIGKAKQKRARKAAQQALGHSPEVICTTCNAAFPSKTQLFTHLRKYDHAQPPIR
jgi:DnaJ family protein A protein 5